MRGVGLGHHGGDCSFETILRRHELTDLVLWRIAEAVHEADLEDERFDAPEAPGLDVVLRGLSVTGTTSAPSRSLVRSSTGFTSTTAVVCCSAASRPDRSSGGSRCAPMPARAPAAAWPRLPTAAGCARSPRSWAAWYSASAWRPPSDSTRDWSSPATRSAWG